MISMLTRRHLRPGGGLLRPFQPCFVMRKVLLRMTSWMHYLYLDHETYITCVLREPEPY